ncbi:MAG TPA: hypothetical protein VFL34_10885 [Candidatus Sulfotelmatobacter sp.]|nr:hypothetical protein [Candidatus Sulfotelmatobacter sp.]
MCPACMANAALVAGSVVSTGGIAAFAAKLIRLKKRGSQNAPAEQPFEEEERKEK